MNGNWGAIRTPLDRSVAQPGSAPRSGRGGRRFESSRSDQPAKPATAGFFIFTDCSSAFPVGHHRLCIEISHRDCSTTETNGVSCCSVSQAVCLQLGCVASVTTRVKRWDLLDRQASRDADHPISRAKTPIKHAMATLATISARLIRRSAMMSA